MERYRHLIIGGGLAADAAVRGIRECDPSGSIGLVGEENHPPYARPPLSKALWKGEPKSSIWRDTVVHDVSLHLGRRVVRIEPSARLATDDQGGSYSYEKLLLAVGGSPRRLGSGGAGVICFRTLDDYERLRALAQPGAAVVVVGAGFIGSEIAASLALAGARVTMVFPEDAIGARAYGPELSRHVTEAYRARGVELLSGTTVKQVERTASGMRVTTSTGRQLEAAAVVAGLGIEPNVALAADAGLAVGNGILVDEHLRTSQQEVFAAGDVANVFSPALGTRVRVEHEDAALAMGRAAGRAMAGDRAPYTHLPFFYSDLFEMGYEAVGRLDAKLEMVSDWQQPLEKGVQYYLDAGRVRGVLLWNVWGQVDAARELIEAPGPFRADDLKGRIAG